MSQLLNQIDGAGPPPLTKEKIQEIPTALISQDHLGKILKFFPKLINYHLLIYIIEKCKDDEFIVRYYVQYIIQNS